MTPGDKALHQESFLGALKLQALVSAWVTSSPASHHHFPLWPVSQTPLEVASFPTAYQAFLSPCLPISIFKQRLLVLPL